jgi:hypothetical protein
MVPPSGEKLHNHSASERGGAHRACVCRPGAPHGSFGLRQQIVVRVIVHPQCSLLGKGKSEGAGEGRLPETADCRACHSASTVRSLRTPRAARTSGSGPRLAAAVAPVPRPARGRASARARQRVARRGPRSAGRAARAVRARAATASPLQEPTERDQLKPTKEAAIAPPALGRLDAGGWAAQDACRRLVDA